MEDLKQMATQLITDCNDESQLQIIVGFIKELTGKGEA